jgi:hypothetical protein
MFSSIDDPYHDKKKCHMALKTSLDGHVSALCFKKPRAINLDVSIWTLRAESVTCLKCLKLMRK